jgi:hypothetical protein
MKHLLLTLKTIFMALGLSHGIAQTTPYSNSETYPPEPNQQQAFMLRVGEQQDLGTVTLLFNKVIDDSRCSPYMQCYWPGEATLILTLLNNQSAEFSLKMGGLGEVLESSETVLKNYQIKLLWLSQEGEYRAVFMVAKKEEQ